MRARVWAGFAGLAVLWGSEWLLRPEVSGGPRLEMAAIRCALAALVLLPWLMRRLASGQSRGWLLPSVVAGLLLWAAPELLSLVPVRSSPGVPTVALAAVPLIAVLFAGEAEASLAPCVVGLGGVALLVGNAVEFRTALLPGAFLKAGEAVTIAAGLAVMWRKLRQAPVCASICVQMLAAAVVLFCGIPLGWGGGLARWSGNALGLLAVLSGITLAGGLLLLWLVEQVGPAAAATVQWAAVLVGTAESALIFARRPDWEMTVGALIALGSVIWISRAWVCCPGMGAGVDAGKTLTLRVTHE